MPEPAKLIHSFVFQVLSVVGIAVVFAVYPLMKYGTSEMIHGAIAGTLLSVANVLAGYAAISYGFDKSYTVFLRVVLGGMGIRMLIVLALLLVMIEVFHYHAVALVLSLLGFYLTFLVMEVFFIQKSLNKKIQR
jgi:hypothetical protein